MPLTVKVNVLNISAANSSNERTATYSAGTGNPSWVTVTETGTNAGNIDLSNPAQSGKNQTVNIEWTLPSDFIPNFEDDESITVTAVAPATSTADFTYVSGSGTKILTVSDSNNDTTPGLNYSYRLNLSDGTFIDPKVINY